MVTTRELAIARSVIYASLFDYPLTLEQLHYSLIESEQTRAEILAVYEGSELLQDIIEYRDGFFFPIGRGDLIAERRRREARSDAFLARHRLALRLICALPFTRLVALSGSIAHRNLEPNGDLDLFIVTRGPRVWTVTVLLLVLTKLLRRRRTICANFRARRFAPRPRSAGSVHRQPGDPPAAAGRRGSHRAVPRRQPVRRALLSEQRHARGRARRTLDTGSRSLRILKGALETVLTLPSPLIEAMCRRLYAWHLQRRAGSWRSPDQVRLQSDYLKLHTRSHRHTVLERFEATVDRLMQMARPTPDDLFRIFPDLPGLRKRTAAEQVERVHRQVEETRERANANIQRQQAAARTRPRRPRRPPPPLVTYRRNRVDRRDRGERFSL